MKIIIGVISYLPDDTKVREERLKRFQSLIKQCRSIFPELPIYCIAQNYKESDYNLIALNVNILHYDNVLGITNARKELIKVILDQGIDYCIMFDDDCVLEGTLNDGIRFIEMLKNNPNNYIFYRFDMFKLCAISNYILQNNKIPDLSVQDGTGIEDMAFSRILRKRYPELEIKDYNWGTIKETSVWHNDQYSTWDRYNIAELVKKSRVYIKNQLNEL